jgi:RHS repeat-associated protein
MRIEEYVAAGQIASQLQNSLTSKLEAALKSLQKGKQETAINQLEAFINQVEAQRGKKISLSAADALITQAQAVIVQLGGEPKAQVSWGDVMGVLTVLLQAVTPTPSVAVPLPTWTATLVSSPTPTLSATPTVETRQPLVLSSLNSTDSVLGRLVTIDYTYDPLHRLTGAMLSSGEFFQYTYDEVGNRIALDSHLGDRISVYDSANRLIQADGVNYQWDDNGNLRSDGVSTFDYDHAHRLTSLEQAGHVYTYTYDGLGVRLTQTVDGDQTRYVVDQNLNLPAVLRSDSVSYLYGLTRIGEFRDGQWFYHLTDGLGSVRQIVDFGGELRYASAFTPFGETLETVGGFSSEYEFAGDQRDQSGLTYLRARYLDSANGRFISKDPVVGPSTKPSSYHGYAYAYDDPVNRSDPSGRYPIEDGEDSWKPPWVPPIIVGPNDLRVDWLFGAGNPGEWIRILNEYGACNGFVYPIPQSFYRRIVVRITPYLGIQEFFYDLGKASTPLKYVVPEDVDETEYDEFRSTGEESVAIRIMVGEIGSRLMGNIHGVQEALGALMTAQWRSRQPASVRWECTTLTDCLTRIGAYKALQKRIAFNPLCIGFSLYPDTCGSFYAYKVSDEVALEEAREIWIRHLDMAAVAYNLLKQDLVADFTGGADSYNHRCGGGKLYGAVIPEECEGTPYASIGPMYFFKRAVHYGAEIHDVIQAAIDCEKEEGVRCTPY